MLTVSQLVQQLENVVSENFPNTCTLVGEVNNWSISRGHAYFSLKDQLATISAIMWKSKVSSLKQIPKLGRGAEALMKDMKTDVNVPFVLKWDGNNWINSPDLQGTGGNTVQQSRGVLNSFMV